MVSEWLDNYFCNNHEVLSYFPRKLYCDFLLNEVQNYVVFLELQKSGGVFSHNRSRAYRDPNILRRLIIRPHVEHVIIPSIMKDTIEMDILGVISVITKTRI